MSVLAQEPYIGYTANGSTGTFAYPYRIFRDTDLVVTVDGAAKLLATDYSVTGANNANGGNVVFTANPPNGALVEIVRDIPFTRETDYQTTGDFRGDTVDNDIDKAVMLCQQLYVALQRAIKLPSDVAGEQLLTGSAADRANKVVGFDGAGNLILSALASGFAAALNPAPNVVPLRDSGGKLPGDITGNAGDATLHAGLTPSQVAALTKVVSARQTVLAGGVDANGYANFLAAGSGLDVNINASSSVPVVITFAEGFGDSGGIDYIKRLTGTQNVPGLTASATNFIYAELAGDGSISYGATLIEPHYGTTQPVGTLVGQGVGTSLTVWTDGVVAFATRNSAAWDGTTAQAYAASAVTAGTATTAAIGKQWASPRLVTGFKLVASSDQGFVNAISPTVTAQLQGSNDGTAWTNLGSSSSATDSGGLVFDFPSLGITTPYLYHRVVISHNGAANVIAVAEAYFYEIPVGTHWFNLNAFRMTQWDGAAWANKRRVFLGEAVTGGSTVSSVVTYALQGRYDSGWFAVTSGTEYNLNDNIGANPELKAVKNLYRKDSSYPACTCPVLAQYYSGASTYIYGSTLGAISRNATRARTHSGGTGGNYASPYGAQPFGATDAYGQGEYRLLVTRGW